MDLKSDYYVYVHIRPDTKEIFYVGKGKKYRCNSKSRRNAYWENVVSKNFGIFIVEKLADNILESLAFELEIEFIKFLKAKGFKITNATEGGEGTSGSPRPKSGEWRNKISESASNTLPVLQFSKSGDIVGRYKSIAEASKNSGLCSSSISKCCKQKILTVGSFIWRYDDGSSYDLSYNPRNRKSIKISQYSKNKEHIRDYSSVNEAAKNLGLCRSSIIKSCKGKNNFSGGYIWRYNNDHVDKFQYVSKRRVRPVSQYTRDNQLVNNFKSIKEASDFLGIDAGDICSCCRGKHKIAGGFAWKYEE